MRNFEIPHDASDNVGEMGKKKMRMIDADRVLEQRKKRAMEEVEGGTENTDEFQPDTKKNDFEKRMARLDPDRVLAARQKREQEARAARVAQEQKMKAEDQARIDAIRTSIGIEKPKA